MNETNLQGIINPNELFEDFTPEHKSTTISAADWFKELEDTQNLLDKDKKTLADSITKEQVVTIIEAEWSHVFEEFNSEHKSTTISADDWFKELEDTQNLLDEGKKTLADSITKEQVAAITEEEWAHVLEDAQNLIESGKGFDCSIELINKMINKKDTIDFDKHFNLSAFSSRTKTFNASNDKRKYYDHIVSLSTLNESDDEGDHDNFGYNESKLYSHTAPTVDLEQNSADGYTIDPQTLVIDNIDTDNSLKAFDNVSNIFYEKYNVEARFLLREALRGDSDAEDLLTKICNENPEIAIVLRELLSSGINLESIL